jgi:tetratricopeptide (TPR) repeat protein
MRVCLALSAAVLALCPLCAQDQDAGTAQSSQDDSAAQAERVRKAAIDEARFRRKQALDRAYALGKRFQTFNNRLVAAGAMAVLGDTVCQYDRAYADTLFTDAVHNLTIVPHVKPLEVANAQRLVLARTAACDPTLAGRLSPWHGGNRQSPRIAVSMLQAGDIEDAIETASAALFTTLSDADTQTFVQFLLELQNQGEAETADDLFIARIAWIGSGAIFDAQEYADLGVYLFDSNPVRVTAGGAPDAQTIEPQDGIGEDAVRAYLETGAWLLALPELRKKALQMRYELALALLPQVETLEPDLEPQYTAALQQLSRALGADEARDKQRLQRPWPETSEDEQIRQTGDPVSEDKARVGFILRHWSRSDTRRMRELASGINNPAVAQKLDNLITYAEAVSDPSARERLRPSTKSALFWLSRDDIDQTVRNVPYADPDLRPLLLMTAARVTLESHLATPDKTAYALHLLADAMTAYNEAFAAEQDPKTPLPGIEDRGDHEEMNGWDEVVEIGDVVNYFPLRTIVDVRDLDMRTALSVLAARDTDRVEAALRELKDERVQARALTYVMGLRLAAAFGPVNPQVAGVR